MNSLRTTKARKNLLLFARSLPAGQPQGLELVTLAEGVQQKSHSASKRGPQRKKNVHRHLFQEKSVAVKKKFRSEVMDGVEACCFDKKRGLRYDWKKSSEINQVGFKERLTDVSEQDRSP